VQSKLGCPARAATCNDRFQSTCIRGPGKSGRPAFHPTRPFALEPSTPAKTPIIRDPGTVEQSEPDRWRQTIEVNLFGAYHCSRLAIPHLRRRGGGKIIAIGSGLGHSSRGGTAAYSCSKAGLWMLVRILADEIRADNIAVNELIPGLVRTDILTSGVPSGLSEEWVKAPDAVVPLALFLATQPSPGPTGQSFSLMRRIY
jgi:3-oxoacyl-[acyl-carrier protein] reductase